jgi:hypothetical protein
MEEQAGGEGKRNEQGVERKRTGQTHADGIGGSAEGAGWEGEGHGVGR